MVALFNFIMYKDLHIRQLLKSWMLPISMLGGILLHNHIGKLSVITPYLIFVMLTITYTRLKISDFKITMFQWLLLAVQVFGGVTFFAGLYFLNPNVAAGAFICFFMPTATAAPVITGMLGGDINKIATYSFLSNLVVALSAPSFLSMIRGDEINFIESFVTICSEVVPLLILPLITAIILKISAPRLHSVIAQHQSVSFWIWAISLFIVMGQAVSFMIQQPAQELPEMIFLTIAALCVCCLQFYVGRKIGEKYGDKISGAQGLGQKNTILGLWMTLTYLHPIVSVAPAAYIVWQNTINSWQLYRKNKNGK